MPMAPSVTPLFPIPQSRYKPHLWVIMTILPDSRVHETVSQRKCWATGSMPEDGLSRKVMSGPPNRAITVLSLCLVPSLRREGFKEERKQGREKVINYGNSYLHPRFGDAYKYSEMSPNLVPNTYTHVCVYIFKM